MSKNNRPTNQNAPKAPAALINTSVPNWVDPIAHLSAKERRKLPVNITGGLRFMVPPPAQQPSPPQQTPADAGDDAR